MMRSIQGLLYFLSFSLFFSSCSKKEWDEYYGRPDSLANPIYQQLQERGNFKNFLKLVDRTTYKETLKGAGLWTVFAPSDDAFTIFLQEKGVGSVDDLPDTLVNQIVRYSLIYDAYNSEKLTDYFSVKGFIANSAFRRRTTYYDFIYDGVGKVNGHTRNLKLIASNRNGLYLPSDFNNKYIGYFFGPFLKGAGLKSSDYLTFFPNSTYSEANVMAARVTEADIVAENGIVHVVDKVNLPPKSIDQYIAASPEYSEFKKLLDYFVTYSRNEDATHKYQVLTGASDSVYAKLYSASLAFSPNNENYILEDANDAQTSFYSIVVPKNDALKDYLSHTVLKYRPGSKSLDAKISELFAENSDILKDLINSHMWRSALWPTHFSNTINFLNEEAKINYSQDVTDKRFLSNGILYGSNKVQEPGVFSTVYGNVYLDSTFSIMRKVMDFYGYSLSIKNSKLKYSILPISNRALRAAGFDYNDFYPSAPVRYNGNGDNSVLKRIIESHIVPTSQGELDNVSGNGIVETWGGEYIKYSNGRFYSSGTYDETDLAKQYVAVDSAATASNGKVHYVSGLLTYTQNAVGKDILDLAGTATSPYYSFYQFLLNCPSMYNSTTMEIQGVSSGLNYTILIPTNDAIMQAVKDGYLPGNVTTGVPKYDPSTQTSEEQSLVVKFIQYHILNKNTVVPDGKKSGAFATLLKNSFGETTNVNVSNISKDNMTITDMKAQNTAHVVVANSNVLSNRTVIHQIDKYLAYTF